jgi:tRNA modification GTPase
MINSKSIDEEIIAAPGTVAGHAAIGIVRLSGPGCVELVGKIFKPHLPQLLLEEVQTRMMHLGHICDQSGKLLDEVLLVVMRGPQSYTRQDVVEIDCHGGIMAVQRIMEQVISAGARLAEPGEFTKRAWLNGRIDLTQVEAVVDLIKAQSDAGMDQAMMQLEGRLSRKVKILRNDLKHLMVEVEASIDFPEEISDRQEELIKQDLTHLFEQIEELLRTAKAGRTYREGIAVVLLGKPNTGKSTLLNQILGKDRALVTNIPGTTRDILEEMVNIKGIPIRMVDTAGIRQQAGIIEKMGIEKAKIAVDQADLILVLFDATNCLDQADQMVLDMVTKKQSILLLNKIDSDQKLLSREQLDEIANGLTILEISASLGWGLMELEKVIETMVGVGTVKAAPVLITRIRHQEALERVRKAIESAQETLAGEGTMDCMAVDLWDAWEALGTILGETVSDEIINDIFQEFCIGK